jgi:Family of unknown function (DUF6600)
MGTRIAASPGRAERPSTDLFVRPRAWAVWLLIAFLGLSPAAGQAASGEGSAADAPGVARVSLIEGQVSFLRGGSGEWAEVSVNTPLVGGDRFYSGPESRAEIELAPGLDARLGGESELEVVELTPRGIHVRLALGRATTRLWRDQGGRVIEIDTPAAALFARESGVYRLEVGVDGRTTVMVREGELELREGDDSYTLAAGGGAVIDALADAPVERFTLGPADPWDDWESERARRVASATSYQYVSEDIYGAEDLDEHGTWAYRRGYGELWRPTTISAGWAPYTTGRWSWVSPWGWTWIDYAPWGWAPYHYGRWVWLDDCWWWAPGTVITAPVYAPALVGFYGAGYGAGVSWSVSVGFGPWIGWAPLGWGEPCIPWWGGWGGARVGVPWWGGWGGPRIVNNVYVNKQVNIYNIDAKRIRFANAKHPGGFTAVSRRSFASGSIDRVPVGRPDERQIIPVAGRIPVAPERASLQAADPARVRAGRALVPPATGLGRAGVERRSAGALARSAPAASAARRPIGLADDDGGAAVSPGRAALSGSRRAATPGRATTAGDPRRAALGSGGSSAAGRTPLSSVGAGSVRGAPAPRRSLPTVTSRGGSSAPASGSVARRPVERAPAGGRLSVVPRVTRPESARSAAPTAPPPRTSLSPPRGVGSAQPMARVAPHAGAGYGRRSALSSPPSVPASPPAAGTRVGGSMSGYARSPSVSRGSVGSIGSSGATSFGGSRGGSLAGGGSVRSGGGGRVGLGR